MLTRVHVENFQSIRSLDIELGKFTVVVGPSNSGKSAFLRALKMLVSNARGKSFITSGAKQCGVAAALSDGSLVAIGRGTKDHYIVSADGGPSETYTKLGGAVPEQVTQLLRMQPVGKGTSLNFAGQFDKPYLLDASGAEVASKLGELTKVTKLFDAAREANRRRLGASSELRTREADLQALLERVPKYQGLPTALQAVHEAELLSGEAVNIGYQRQQLAGAVQSHQVATAALSQAEAAVAALPTAVDVPVDDIETLLQQRVRLAQAYITQSNTVSELAQARGRVEVAAVQEGDAKQAYAAALQELGQCPTCGADAEHMHTELVEV